MCSFNTISTRYALASWFRDVRSEDNNRFTLLFDQFGISCFKMQEELVISDFTFFSNFVPS